MFLGGSTTLQSTLGPCDTGAIQGKQTVAIHFSTADADNREQFSYWREAVCEAYVLLGCESGTRENFKGEIHLERLSNLAVSFVGGSTQEVYRRKRDIARSSQDYFLLSMQLRNHATVAQHDRVGELEPGDFALYSSVDPYQLTLADDFRQLVVQVPRFELLQRLPNADLLTGQTVSGTSELGSLVGGNLLNFARRVSSTAGTVQHLMQDTMIDLIATGLASLEDGECDLRLPEQQLLLRAKAFIRSNLANSELDRRAVAQATGMSVRRLNEVFAADGSSIAAWIRDARTDRIAHDITDVRFVRQSISEIAMKWGFNNLQHFSAVFRKKHGMTPRAYRTAFMRKPQ